MEASQKLCFGGGVIDQIAEMLELAGSALAILILVYTDGGDDLVACLQSITHV